MRAAGKQSCEGYSHARLREDGEMEEAGRGHYSDRYKPFTELVEKGSVEAEVRVELQDGNMRILTRPYAMLDNIPKGEWKQGLKKLQIRLRQSPGP